MAADKSVSQNSGEQAQFQGLNEAVEQNNDTGVMSIESMCMNCHQNVSTVRLRNLYLTLTNKD